MGRVDYWCGIVAALLALPACGKSNSAAGTPETGAGGAAGFSNGGAGVGGSAGAGAVGGAVNGGSAGAGAGGAGPVVVHSGPPCAPGSAPYMDQITSAVPFYDSGSSDTPVELTLHAGVLYFKNETGVMKLPLGQNTPTPVTQIANVSRSLGLFFNDTHVFFDEGPAFKRGALDGSTPTAETVLDGVMYTTENPVAVDAQNLYFIDASRNLASVPVGGGTPKTLASGMSNSSAALSGGYVYFTRSGANADEIARVPVAGGTVESVVSSDSVTTVTTDGTTLFGGGQNGIIRAPIDGSSGPVPIMDMSSTFSFGMDQVVFCGTRVFWQSAGTFGWGALDGTSCEAVVDEVTGFQGFAGTDTDVYIGDNSRIMRIPIQ